MLSPFSFKSSSVWHLLRDPCQTEGPCLEMTVGWVPLPLSNFYIREYWPMIGTSHPPSPKWTSPPRSSLLKRQPNKQELQFIHLNQSPTDFQSGLHWYWITRYSYQPISKNVVLQEHIAETNAVIYIKCTAVTEVSKGTLFIIHQIFDNLNWWIILEKMTFSFLNMGSRFLIGRTLI